MKKLFALIVPAVIVVLWQLASSLNWINPLFLSSPGEVVSTGYQQLVVTKELWADVIATLLRTLAAFVIATVLGVSLGLLLGYFKSIYSSFEFAIDFFRSIPATALFPLFLLFFGIGDEAKVAVAVWACSFVVIINTIYGVHHASKLRLMAAKTMGAKGFFLFKNVVFWEALPHVFAGLRIALSYSLVVVIVTEMFIGTTVGLGHRIIDAQLVYRVPEMYVAIIAAGVLGYLLNKGFLAIEKRVAHWAGK